MSESNRTPVEAHVRKPIARAWGNSFYKVVLGPADNGSQTLCGAKPTDHDLGYGDISPRRPDTDWKALGLSWEQPTLICETCLAEAALIRAARKEAAAKRAAAKKNRGR